ncbi:hypothetical protein PBY51_015629 [Eleginops maclovinus]|uniref:Uncharacterized protein n=1 Tax=Eleginops maclovinus TaxID=56733 RepID=A0AAN8ARG5_ELEMC|nr:hypothetical protein PBY51_015629 [Eleginops maclovinus]
MSRKRLQPPSAKKIFRGKRHTDGGSVLKPVLCGLRRSRRASVVLSESQMRLHMFCSPSNDPVLRGDEARGRGSDLIPEGLPTLICGFVWMTLVEMYSSVALLVGN